jgi:hypothetical protein
MLMCLALMIFGCNFNHNHNGKLRLEHDVDIKIRYIEDTGDTGERYESIFK